MRTVYIISTIAVLALLVSSVHTVEDLCPAAISPEVEAPATEDGMCPGSADFYDSDDPYVYTLDAGRRFDYAYVKSFERCILITDENDNSCYEISHEGQDVSISVRDGADELGCGPIDKVAFYSTLCPTAEPTCPPCQCGTVDTLLRRSLIIRGRNLRTQNALQEGGCPICAECPPTPGPTPAPPTCAPCPCGEETMAPTFRKRRTDDGCPVCLECPTPTPTEPPVEQTCQPCPCGSTTGKRRSGCPICNECPTPTPTEPPVEQTCPPCPCGSTAGKRRSGCPVCNECPSTEPPVEQTCPPCPCGSTTGKRRSGCPVCNTCPTDAPTSGPTEPPVEGTCPPCPCGSTAGKRRSGCPVCNECQTSTTAPSTAAPTTIAPSTSTPTTEPPVQQTPEPTCAPCPCGTSSTKRRTGCPVCNVCPSSTVPPTSAPTVAPSTTTAAPTEGPVQQTPAPSKDDGTNISGNNNAKSGTSTVVVRGFAVLVAAVAMCL